MVLAIRETHTQLALLPQASGTPLNGRLVFVLHDTSGSVLVSTMDHSFSGGTLVHFPAYCGRCTRLESSGRYLFICIVIGFRGGAGGGGSIAGLCDGGLAYPSPSQVMHLATLQNWYHLRPCIAVLPAPSQLRHLFFIARMFPLNQ